MLKAIVYCMVFCGAGLMVFNIVGFIRFARQMQKHKAFDKKRAILNIPIILLILFLLGYLAVGLFGKPDLIVAGILFGGSVFVFIIYKLLSGITQRIIESEALEVKLRTADEVTRVKTSFLASVSHEMRTPLNVILGLDAAALRSPDAGPETKEKLEKIGLSAKLLLGLINRLLNMNEAKSGKLMLADETFSLSDALAQVDAIADTASGQKGLAYETKIQPGADGKYVGDVTHLKQILLCVVDNAIKYTQAPGKVSLAATKVGETDDARMLRFTVSDTGIGIESEFLSHIFDEFSMEDESFSSQYGGSGLSLSLAKSIVELMGGKIAVKSEKNVGTTVTVTVPFRFARSDESGAAPSGETSDGKGVTLEGKRILIVEDLPENAEIVQDLLELEGVVCEHAENGQIAVEMFGQSAPFFYDAILMDLRMPVMDGHEATRRIRALRRPDAHTVPIVALTANAFESDVRASLEAGMDAHLAKPADADRLYETLRGLIARCRGEEGGGVTP